MVRPIVLYCGLGGQRKGFGWITVLDYGGWITVTVYAISPRIVATFSIK
jgi:hypothetical protein